MSSLHKNLFADLFGRVLGGDPLLLEGDDGDEEFAITNSGGNEDDDYFDHVVGCLQEIILDPDFDRMQK